MAYAKKTWADDEVITKEALNNIEDGILNVEKAIPKAANKTTAGTVKQMALIQDLSTETNADLKNKVNSILAELKKQGIMANA